VSHSQVYIPGNRIVECDVCGLTYRFSEMRRGIFGTQKGLIVCPFDFDGVHPNDARVPNKIEGTLKEVK